jgi:hypothetical protein
MRYHENLYSTWVIQGIVVSRLGPAGISPQTVKPPQMHRRARRALVLAALLLASSTVPFFAAAASGTNHVSIADNPDSPDIQTGSATAEAEPGPANTESRILVTEEFRLTPDRAGRFDVRWYFDMPDNVDQVETRLPADAENVRTDGFSRTTDSDGFEGSDRPVYEWSSSGTRGSITFTMPANVTANARGPEAASGRHRFVDTGDWAIVRRPTSPSVWYRYTAREADDQPTVAYRNGTAGPGVVGQAMVYMGEYEDQQWEAHDQQFRFVVPETATLTASRSEIVESVSSASGQLRIGDRDDHVLLIAAPTSVSWGVLGLQRGDRDFYVLANQTLDTPGNVWLHEYVHTRQNGNWTADTQWFVEGSAEYYAALLALEQDHIDYDAFRDHLARGTRDRFEDVRLISPETWYPNSGDYIKGALVAGALDRRIRIATDRGARLQSVFRRMNARDTRIGQSEFIGYVAASASETAATEARRLTETTMTPDTWSVANHSEVFGTLPAIFRYDLPRAGTERFRVEGPYRNGSIATPTLVPGETLVLDVGVRNVGGAEGEYTLSLTVDESVSATRSGTLQSGGATAETVAVSFNATGSYQIGAGDERTTVAVREPAVPQVTAIRAEQEEIGSGEQIEVTAVVGNPADRPARGSVQILREGTPVATRDISLPPGETTTVSTRVTLSDPGTYRFSAGEQSVEVVVRDTKSPSSDGDTPGMVGPGFGPGLVVLALTILSLVGRRTVSQSS